MVSKWDMKNYMKNNPDKFPYIYKEEEDALYDKETNEYLTSLDTFLELYRKKSGESFECIYDMHVMLYSVLRCTECGTVIFTYDDERYDPHLKCPTCTDYETHFEYWTKEDINSDEEKQATIEHFREMTEWQIEREKRVERRNGKQDWQIAVKKFYGKKLFLGLFLECDDITKSYFKGLRLKIELGSKEDGFGYTIKHFFTVPLSWSQLLFQCKWHMEKRKERK